MRDYSWVRLKYLMDVKSKPMFKVLLCIGIIGTIFILILLIISTNIPYRIMTNITIRNNTIKVKHILISSIVVSSNCGFLKGSITQSIKLIY